MPSFFANPFLRFMITYPTSLLPGKAALCGLLLLAAGLQSVRASTLLYFDDFSGYLGLQTGSSMGVWTLSGNPGTPEETRWIKVLKDSENQFGRGSENHYLSFRTSANGAMIMRATDQFHAGSIMTLSVSIIVPNNPGFNRAVDIRAGTDIIGTGNIANRASLAANAINGGDFTFDSAHRVDIVFNSSATDLANYYEGNTLLSKTFDVWIDGERKANGVQVSQAGILSDISSLSFQTLSGTTASTEFYLDWVAASQGIAIMQPIPEPATALLLLPVAALVSLRAARVKARKS